MSDIAIRASGLSKRYRIGLRQHYGSLRDVIAGKFFGFRAAGVGSGRRPSGRFVGDMIWALRDVSLEVRHGEVIGVIGPNGAGKTTLLKILSRITEPTEGEAEIHGRMGSLLEVGTGFHPEMSGRENIHLNGAILGMRRREIERKFDEIVSFAGVEEFLDTEVKHYSTGMYMRLAFAVASHLEPDILVVDEVLSVGDVQFQEKCLGKMSQVAGSGRTVLFVSHNLAAVRSLCTRACLIDSGQIRLLGKPDEVISEYLTSFRSSESPNDNLLAERSDRSGSGRVRVIRFEARASEDQPGHPRTGSDAEFIIGYTSTENKNLVRFEVGFVVVDQDGVAVFTCTTKMTRLRIFHDAPPSGRIVCKMKSLPLVPGTYWVNITMKDEWGLADSIMRAASFRVIYDGTGEFIVIPSRAAGHVVVHHEWAITSESMFPR